MTSHQEPVDASGWRLVPPAVLEVTCPVCRAVRGAQCATPRGLPRAPHQERLELRARRHAELLRLARWEGGSSSPPTSPGS